MTGDVEPGCEAGPGGALMIWHDVLPEDRHDMLAWYDREHHAERIGIDGFIGARRYHAMEASRMLFIHYDLAGSEILASPAYLDRVNNPTAWTLRCQPMIHRNSRTACTVLARRGTARGRFALTATLPIGNGISGKTDAKALLSSLPGSKEVSAEVLAADTVASGLPSEEKKLRGAADERVGMAVLFHADDADLLREIAAFLKADHSILQSSEIGLFQLAFALTK